MKDMLEILKEAKIVAVLSVNDKSAAVDLAHALLAGGVSSVEMTLRTPNAMECIREVVSKVPQMRVGVGTVLTIDQIRQVKDSGALFAVSPGCNPAIIDAARELEIPFAPGIMTPSEIEMALEHGCRAMKFFPAESSGGLKHWASRGAPYKHLGLGFIPRGGLWVDNAAKYLSSPLVLAIGGSWLATPALIESHDWDKITANAKEAVGLIPSSK